METKIIRGQPLMEYADLIKNSFNCNNYVFAAKSEIKKENQLVEKIRFESDRGFNQYQNIRVGMLVTGHKSRIVNGLDEFLREMCSSYDFLDAESIKTELYDTPSNPVIIEFYKK
jgi:hypothetical protein